MIFQAPYSVGLDIGTSSIKVIALQKTSKGTKLRRLGIEELQPEVIVEGSIMDAETVVQCIRRLFKSNHINIKNVITGISGNAVITKKVTVPQMSDEELKESIQWESGKYIPFDIDDVNLDYQKIGETSNKEMEILLVAAKKDVVDEYRNIINQAGLKPITVDINALALCNAFEFSYSDSLDGINMLIDFGAGFTNISILEEGKWLFSRDILLGGNRFTQALQRSFGLSFDQAEALKKGHEIQDVKFEESSETLKKIFQELLVEVERSCEFLKSSSTPKPIKRILLAGGGAYVKGFNQTLAEKFEGSTVEILDSLRSIIIPSKEFDLEKLQEISPRISTAVGLALRAAAPQAREVSS